MAVEHLQDVPSSWSRYIHCEPLALLYMVEGKRGELCPLTRPCQLYLDNSNLIWLDIELAHLSDQVQSSLLGYCKAARVRPSLVVEL